MTRLERYEQRTQTPLLVLALLFLAVYGLQVVQPGLPGAVRDLLATANGVIWLAFAADLAFRVALARRRVHYLLTHPIDVLVVVLPMLRPLRVLRVFAAGQQLLTRGRGLAQSGQAVVVTAAILVLVGALAVLDAERGAPDASIVTFGDALWWAITTVTTVGYGDLYPVTGLGRIVAALLMLVGISLVGLVTATVASWFVAQGRSDEAERQQLLREVGRLQEKVDALVAGHGEAPVGRAPEMGASPAATERDA